MYKDKVEIKNIDGGEIEITGELPVSVLEEHRSRAIAKISKNLEIPGFRKGKAPEDVITKKVGDMLILEEMAEYALAKAYPEILIENKIEAMGLPKVNITKIAKGEPLGFKIQTTVMPEVALPDYKEIAKKGATKKEKIEVSDKEVGETIEQILKQRAAIKKDSETDEKKDSETKELKLPELNDEFVKTLGDFNDVGAFKKQIRENMQKEKENKAQQKKRIEILEGILAKTKVVVPKMLIESELDKMSAQFEGDIARMGLKFDEYLKHIKKTTEDLRKEWKSDAEKRAKTQLVLNKIAVQEKIEAPKEELEKQKAHLLKKYKDADPHNIHVYVETILINEEIFKFLEKQEAND